MAATQLYTVPTKSSLWFIFINHINVLVEENTTKTSF